MSCDPRARSTRGEDVGEVPGSSVPDLVTPFRSAFRLPVEDFQKFLAATQEKWQLDIEETEALRKEREALRARLADGARNSGVLREENERLRAEVASLEDEMRKAEARGRDEAGMLKENERLAAQVASLEDNIRKVEERERDAVGMLKEENERLCAKVASLEDEMRKGEARGREVEMLREENVRLRRNQEVLHKINRMLESEKAVGLLGNEEGMKNADGEKGVPGEANGFNMENEDGGDGIGAGKGNISRVGGSVFTSRKARTMLYLGEGTCASASASPSAGSRGKSLVKDGGVSQGDGRTPLREVEVCIIDDDEAGSGHLSRNYLSYQKPTVGMHLGGSNQEREKKELKRKRGLCLDLIEGKNNYNHANGAGISRTQDDGRKMIQNGSIEICSSASVSYGLHKSFTQSVRNATIVKQHEQKNIKGKDSKNSSSKLTVVNSIAHVKKVSSDTAKPANVSCLHGGAWENVEELRSDFERDDELCVKAVCALYRRQKSAQKAMEKSISQGL
ncbi:hypothetical protein NL676_010066 [Syzygium grande]|nr:hypothetical protein NL676_010066 [Syzygium grande]